MSHAIAGWLVCVPRSFDQQLVSLAASNMSKETVKVKYIFDVSYIDNVCAGKQRRHAGCQCETSSPHRVTFTFFALPSLRSLNMHPMAEAEVIVSRHEGN